jgi:putative ABC transport system permease protein
LVGASLLVRSFQALSEVKPGFDPTRVLTFRVSANWNEIADRARVTQRIDGTIDALLTVPGVEATATANALPGVPSDYESTFKLIGAQRDAQGPGIVAESRTVSPGYFATMQIPLVTGEACRRQPRDAPREVMVNETFVKQYVLAGVSAVGLGLAPERRASQPSRIIGVVRDARERGLDRDAGPVVYSCLSAPNPMPYFLLRTHSSDPAALAASVRLKIKEIEPARAVYDIAPLDERIGDAFTQNRLRTVVLILFAMTALLLACVGLYGTLNYIVTLRRREIGLRLALGASRSEVIQYFMLHGLRVVGAACLCGLALAVGFGRVLSGMLYGVSPYDSLTLAGVAVFVMLVAALATLLPSMRAASVQPIQVLREG